MNSMFNSSNIQLIATITTMLTSIVSIFIAIKSLKLTNKSIINANRPYIVVYSDFMQISETRMNYLIIKNFGKSSAIIDCISFSNDKFYANKNRPFYNFLNCSIAPNQVYSSRVLYKQNPYISFDVTIEYHDNIAKYTETFSINTEAIAKQLVSLTSDVNQTKLENIISNSTQELIRRNF